MQHASITITNFPPQLVELLGAHLHAELARLKIKGAQLEIVHAGPVPTKESDGHELRIELEGVAQFIDDARAAETAASRLIEALDRLQGRLAPKA